jgi:serine/threonine-protein kinase PknG
VYCDFKPDNLIQIGDDVKLIDLGGVRRLDDADSAIYGTVGYQAPEVAEVGVSVASDIYTLGRALLVLAMEFRGYQSTFVDRLPPVDGTPLFGRFDSFYRFIAKACAPDPADRFASVAEMRVQLLGVLREVVAAERGEPAARTSAPSLLFGPPPLPDEFTSWRGLPVLRPDPSDSAAAWLAVVDVPDPAERIDQLQAAPDRTAGVLLELARAGLEADRLDVVAAVTEELLAADPWDWRAVWMQGLAALAADDPRAAQGAFNAVYGQVAGELAPKLALAVACAGTGDVAVAEGLFLTCARTDAAYVPVCAFALAALHSGSDRWQHAVAALDLVPMTSRAYPDARLRRAWEVITREKDLASIVAALHDVGGVGLDPATVAEVTREGLESALELVRANGPLPGAEVNGRPVTEDGLRDGLEATLRQLATATDDHERRVELVDEANQVRRWTLW